jgi:Glycosyl hydrolase family 65 central catalytic domain/Glycosyl hydrolase family 65, N-terminal domain
MNSGAGSMTPANGERLPSGFERRFEAVVFDWDVMARTDGWVDGGILRSLVEELCDLGCDLAIITDARAADVDARLAARPGGPGRILLCADHGSEIFEARKDGLRPLYRREATRAEAAALDVAAAATVAGLRQRGLRADVISRHPSRRSIAVPRGMHEAVDVAVGATAGTGLANARVTTDDERVAIGLTDRSDSLRWVLADLWSRGVGPILVAGDHFGELTDTDPARPPPGVLVSDAGGGLLRRVLSDQARRRRHGDVPEVVAAPEWSVAVDGYDPRLERAHESLLTIADGRLGTRGSPLVADAAATPEVFLAGCYDGTGSETELARLPSWSRLAGGEALHPRRRTIDLHTGVLYEEGPLTSLRFSSLARPGTVAMRVRADQAQPPSGGAATVRSPVAPVLRERRHGVALDRFGAYDPDPSIADAAVGAAEEAGFERLLREHREAWARRWRDADVVVDGDPQLRATGPRGCVSIPTGHAHIRRVTGPDEYHELVDDNAFTNVMARWNLRRAAALDDVAEPERATWRSIADALVDGYDRRSGVYEQFAGFFGLEPIMIAEIASRRPVAADLMLGAERTAHAQVVKQADVLMLHQLVPDEVVSGSLPANLDFYEPRTAHGSSLSPAVHAALLARAARFEPALQWLRVAARIDFDDLTGTTAGGVHLATMGGLWQALVFGFAGVRATTGHLVIDPRLPRQWSALELGLRYRDVPFRLRIESARGGAPQGVEIDSDALALRRTGGRWEAVPT